MKLPQAPFLDSRREVDFEAELTSRARTWVPSWSIEDDAQDFGRALLKIAARFSSEVAERLDKCGDKMMRGFLDWLAVRGEAARPARMPVVFKMVDKAPAAVFAPAPVRMQAGDASVVFETEDDVLVVPGRLEIVVATDADADAFFASPPGFTSLDPLEPLPTEWRVKTFAAGNQKKVQLNPELGLEKGLIVAILETEYRLEAVEKDIVTLDQKLPAAGVQADAVVHKVDTFAPFDEGARNLQEHAIYIGHTELLNIEAAATIDVVGAQRLGDTVTWQYWGKVDGNDEVDWQLLKPAPVQKSDAVVLDKPAGAVELRKVGAVESSRWIRAWMKKVADNAKPGLSVDSLKLRVNCITGDALCPLPDEAQPGPEAEAMANSTPLVLSEAFYPLGREPRQFDAFYLGCAEAFSKQKAKVQICFEMANASCGAFTAVRSGVYKNQVLAGVGKDRALHLFHINPFTGVMRPFLERGPLRPPSPGEQGKRVDREQAVVLNPRCRPAILSDAANSNDFRVAVAARGEIWVWHEVAADRSQSGWIRHSRITDLPGRPALIEDIIVLDSKPTRPGAVLSNGRLWVFNDPEWIEPPRNPTPPPTEDWLLRDYAVLAPIRGDATDSMVAVGADDRFLYKIKTDGTETAIFPANAIPPQPEVDIGVEEAGSTVPVGGTRPAAVDDGVGNLLIVTVSAPRDKFLAIKNGSAPQELPIAASTVPIGTGIDTVQLSAGLQFSFGLSSGAGNASVGSWIPTFIATDPPVWFEAPVPGATREIGGTPLTAGKYVVVPGDRGDIYVSEFDETRRRSFTTPLIEGVILQQTATPFTTNDFLSVMTTTNPPARVGWAVTANNNYVKDTKILYVNEPAFGNLDAVNPQVLGYRDGTKGGATIDSTTQITLDAADPDVHQNDVLRIQVAGGGAESYIKVVGVDPANPLIISLDSPLSVGSGTANYWRPKTSTAEVVPVIRFDPWSDGFWDASILDRAKFYFPGAAPLAQRGTAFSVDTSDPSFNHPVVVALESAWTTSPPGPTFFLEDALGPWQQQLAGTASNPELSWEYWNGKGWWSLVIDSDGTLRLAKTGAVELTVPPDIAESDWAGKKNFWIRARLVGGDYGREDVKVISKPGSNPGETEQTVVRSSENIKAPQVLELHISYSICDEAFPTYLLALDSGTYRDQSDANQTAGAIVEGFIPLAIALGRLSGTAPIPKKGDEACPPPCDCGPGGAAAGLAADSSSVGESAKTTHAPASGRTIFLGSNAKLSGSSVRALLAVDKELDFDKNAPLEIAALVGGRFLPVVATDRTRALGESGLLTFAFGEETTLTALFGEELHWLRLSPKAGDTEWTPKLSGAYLNAVWASARETLTRELVGSSEGAPRQKLKLARPPVLRDTLELRVKEPLGEEERTALLKNDPKRVISDAPDLPGDWVLWRKVIDPEDEGPTDRVYVLDEATGEIRFGDGQHGAIPPVGTDSIVAFAYQRTEPPAEEAIDVPANSIPARAQVNLVTPVGGVEAVFSADQAAGGAPPERDERVLRYGSARLRHRGRAVTARDFEDLALASSPDIAQARAIVRGRRTRLVVVMRGKDTAPGAAQRRELGRLLLGVAPAAFTADALSIVGPSERHLRVELRLSVDSLDHAGAVAEEVTTRLEGFFDTVTGGISSDGWPLGASPREDDIALALLDVPHLESIASVVLVETFDNGTDRPWTGPVKPNELARLAKDAVRLEFGSLEVPA